MEERPKIKKISLDEYRLRKCRTYKKNRQRKKSLRDMDRLFMEYCISRYGRTLSTLFYAKYGPPLSANIPSNPLLEMHASMNWMSGARVPIPR